MLYRSIETRNKISRTLKKAYNTGRIEPWNKGRMTPECVKEKISKSEKGKILSEETKRKISEARKEIKFSEAHKRNLSEVRKRMKFSKRHRENLRKSHEGKILSEKHKEEISKAHLKRWDTIGRKLCKKSYHPNANRKYREWRRAVFERDNYICQLCGDTNRHLEAHHIKLWAAFPKLRYKVDNGITLCKKCHKLINSQPWINNFLLTNKNVLVARFVLQIVPGQPKWAMTAKQRL